MGKAMDTQPHGQLLLLSSEIPQSQLGHNSPQLTPWKKTMIMVKK